MPDFDAAIRAILSELVAFRHDLHMHPELAFEEHRTSERILAELRKLPGLSIRTGVAGTGIVATLNADRPGRCVALRADIDALPILEANTFEYRSRHEGKMHACGHDGHATCLLGAARVLSRFAAELPGKVKFVFQPAEEHGAGGERIVQEGALEDPKVDAAFALHGWPDAEVGQVVVGRGPIMASATSFDIELTGVGTHAAYPHNGSDVVLTASHIVTALQAVAARFTNPVDPVVVSICTIQAGAAYNVLPEKCLMKGTSRALTHEVRDAVLAAIRRTVESVAAAFGVRAEFRLIDSYPPTINDTGAAELVAAVARERLGAAAVKTDPPVSMGAEDFAYYGEKVPAAMWRLGVRPSGRADYPKLHHPSFDFTDAAIPYGVAMHCGIAERFLRAGR